MSKLSWLEKEAPLWVEKGIITPDQAEHIHSLYPKDSKNRVISALLVLGATLLGAGIILFFASNWQYLNKMIKVAIVFGALIMFHISSELMTKNSPRLSLALALLASIMYGSGIWLVAQIFHISSHFPNGILLWLIGIIPAAYLLKNRLILVLCSLLLGMWVIAEQTHTPMVLVTGLLLFAIIFYLTYTLRCTCSLVPALASAIVFMMTKTVLIYNNTSDTRSFFLIPVIALPLSLLTALLARHPSNQSNYFSEIFSIIGIVGTGVSLYAMSFEYFAIDLSNLFGQTDTVWQFAFLCLIPALLGLYLSVKFDGSFLKSVENNLPWLAGFVLSPAVLILPVNTIGLMITLNLFMFFWALMLLYSGYRKQSNLHFTAGIGVFTFFIIAEYFNLFWQMLPKSLFFIAGGSVLMAGGAYLERRRRKLVRSWSESEGGADIE